MYSIRISRGVAAVTDPSKEDIMSDEVYYRLREFLDRLPGGMPTTDSGVEIKLLKRYFTPEQAELAIQLKTLPEPVAAIAQRAGMEEAEAAEMLETMAKQGSIYRLRADDQVYYMALHFLIGIYEFHVNMVDRELAELLEEYIPYMVDSWRDVPTKQLRVVPVESAVDPSMSVATYENVRELVKDQSPIAVAECICRKERALLGQGCDHPRENCLTFGFAAQYYIENGIGREITLEECLDILKEAEESGLVLSPSNSQAIMNICCCCKCSCGMLRGLSLYERPADHMSSSFQSRIDPDLCSLCGSCLERCPMDAILERDDFMEVDEARCIGCGLCVSTCPEEAICMVARPDIKVPAATFGGMQSRIASERGL
jgi:electron transport complex protein RnfB